MSMAEVWTCGSGPLLRMARVLVPVGKLLILLHFYCVVHGNGDSYNSSPCLRSKLKDIRYMAFGGIMSNTSKPS